MSVKLRGNIHRTAPVQTYEQLGQYYEEAIGLLNRYQEGNLGRMLGE
jgi:hypothetical protein